MHSLLISINKDKLIKFNINNKVEMPCRYIVQLDLILKITVI